MKVALKREVLVGLSVLVVLAVALVAVAAQRLLRRPAPPEVAAAAAVTHETSSKPLWDEHRDKEIEAHKSPAAAPKPLPNVDIDHDLDKPLQWDPPARKLETKANRGGEPALLAVDPPPAQGMTGHDRHEKAGDVRAVSDQTALPSPDSDDRYKVPAATPAALPPARTGADAARPMVIQVSGDATDASSRRPEDRTPDDRARTPGPAGFDQSLPSLGGAPPAAMVRPDRMEPRSLTVADARGTEAAVTPNPYVGRDSRYADDSTATAGRPASVPGNYPGPVAGYGRDEIPRRDETPRRADPPAPYGPNPLRNDGMYEVQPNDSYWTISERVYGNGAYFRALAEVNRGKAARPDRLSPGLLISAPPVAQLEKDYPDFCPRPNRREPSRNRTGVSLAAYSAGRTYVVQDGDSLTSIARNELGKVSRWAEIYQLNREALGKDYDYLTPGMRLALPPRESQSSDRTTRRSEDVPPLTR